MKRLLPLLFVAAVAQAQAGTVFTSSNLNADITFRDALSSTSMTIAYNGSNYYSSSGGGTGGNRFASYDSAGNALTLYAPGLDFRSVFTDNSGNVLARQFNDNTIYKMSAPGVFTSAVVLGGAALDMQSSVDMNDAGQYVANAGGNIRLWDAAGNELTGFNLNAYSSGGYPADRGVAAVGNYLLTYNSGTLDAWNYSGNLVDSTTLNLGGASFDSNFSLSYANNHVFVVTNAGGNWHGYAVGEPSNKVPEPSSLALLGLALAGLAFARRRAQA